MRTSACTLIPLYSSSGTSYREWEMWIENTLYTIVDEAGAWALLQRQGEGWEDIGGRGAVRNFIREHRLMLAE